MKPNPYFANDKERAELLARRDSFKFTEPEPLPKLVVLIAGREGTGKTHLACTMNELGPVFLLDTEYRAQIVTNKFSNVKFALTKNFIELVVAVKHILKNQSSGTIVIDSGSDLQTFAEIAYLERSEKEKVGLPWNWAEVWRLCNALIDGVRLSQNFHLVVTSRVKEEYANDRPTGQIIPRIYSTLPYKADLVLQFADKPRKLFVTKNGFSGDTVPEDLSKFTLPGIIEQLAIPSAPVTAVPGQSLKIAS